MRILTTMAFLLICASSMCQDMSRLFAPQKFVWCGLDFSMVKCIGPEGFTDPKAIKEKYFDAWNDLMLAESSKYDFKSTFQKSEQINMLNVSDRRNELPDFKTLVIDEPYAFKQTDLQSIIDDYKFENLKEGLGLVYVFESLNKTETEAVFYVVFFDLATNEIIWLKKHNSSPSGFGIRNYWAGSIYRSLTRSKYDYKKELNVFLKAEKKKNKN